MPSTQPETTPEDTMADKATTIDTANDNDALALLEQARQHYAYLYAKSPSTLEYLNVITQIANAMQQASTARSAGRR